MFLTISNPFDIFSKIKKAPTIISRCLQAYPY